MNLFCQSVSFSDSPARTGDRLVLDIEQQRNFLHNLHNYPQISDALILNTCNRLEFYFYAKKNFDASSYIDDFISHNFWNEYKQSFTGLDVAKHLFRVAAGLESQIIGENEIFSQLKSAYSFALRCNCVNTMFHHLLHSAFRVAKAVRRCTNISAGALSIAQAAVELAASNVDIEKTKVLVVGSGTSAGLVVRHLLRKNVQDLTVSARNQAAAELLIENAKGRFLPLNELETGISGADIVFAASAAKEPLIKFYMLKNRIKPLILIDISVPPNVELQVKNISNIKIFNIDSLSEIIKVNNQNRRAEIPKAEAIIDEHLRAFKIWRNRLVSPAITMAGSVVSERRLLNEARK